MTSADAYQNAERCELCIVGAGIGGLNALFAASHYLSGSDRVILVDRRAAAGGMWNDTYDYVRLHQPHPFFTAGDVPWTLGRERQYLARGVEVLDHLRHCANELGKRVALDPFYEHEYRSHEEVTDNGCTEVLVKLARVNGDGTPVYVRAKKLIQAQVNAIPSIPPLELSSDEVRSVAPAFDDILGDEMRASDAPIYVVGGGKTGMDTAHALIQRFPDKAVTLLTGLGTVFLRRDALFPTGVKRWVGGLMPAEVFVDLARHFDGDNEAEVLRRFHDRYGIALHDDDRNFMFGLLSDAEKQVIARGTREIIRDYLEDVVDRDGQPVMRLRGGEERTIEPGSWIVNCTGHIFRGTPPSYQPFVSESGAVLAVHGMSAIALLPALAAYFLTHVSYLDAFGRLPLYEVDLVALREKARDVVPWAGTTMNMYNIGLIAGATPSHVMMRAGIDSNRWYPLPRQLPFLLQMRRNFPRNAEHYRRTLDRVREKYDLRCGPVHA
jgi:hypothetical protein